jgi:hypothetical protein
MTDCPKKNCRCFFKVVPIALACFICSLLITWKFSSYNNLACVAKGHVIEDELIMLGMNQKSYVWMDIDLIYLSSLPIWHNCVFIMQVIVQEGYEIFWRLKVYK